METEGFWVRIQGESSDVLDVILFLSWINDLV
jgi:hypothetical protein